MKFENIDLLTYSEMNQSFHLHVHIQNEIYSEVRVQKICFFLLSSLYELLFS